MASTLIRIAQTSILETAYPVGALYVSVVSTNPNTLFGFGTWSAFGAGKCLVGIKSTDADFDTVEETGGAKTHTLATGEMASHLHNVDLPNTTSGGHSADHTHTYTVYSTLGTSGTGSNQTGVWISTSTGTSGANSASHTHNLDIAAFDSASAGSDTAHNNIQPSIVVYVFKRTA